MIKKLLTKTNNKVYYYKDGVRIDGVHTNIRGNVSDIEGDVDCCLEGYEGTDLINVEDLIKGE